jgi:hypothetical protein
MLLNFIYLANENFHFGSLISIILLWFVRGIDLLKFELTYFFFLNFVYVMSSFMTYFNKNKTTYAVSRAGTAYPSGAPRFTSDF